MLLVGLLSLQYQKVQASKEKTIANCKETLTGKVPPIVSGDNVLPNVGILRPTNDAFVLLGNLIVFADIANGSSFRLKFQPDRIGRLIGHDFG